MLNRKTLALLLASFLLVGTALAVPPQGGDAGTKIAFVNSNAVLQGVAEGKQKLAQIEEFVQSRRQELERRQSELETLRSEYASKSRMLNPDTAGEMQQQITDKERELRRMQEDFELEVNRRQNQLLNSMSTKIQEVIAGYAEQNGIGAVFLDNPTLPYFAPVLDITQTVIQLYDEKYPAGGGAQPAAGAGANP